MSKNGENFPRWQKFYTAAGSDGSDKSHLCLSLDLKAKHVERGQQQQKQLI